MKPMALALLLWTCSFRLVAQESSAAAALLEIRAAEEEFKRLAAIVLHVQETQELILRRLEELQKRQGQLADEIEKVRDQAARASANLASRADLNDVIKSLHQLDQRREADKKLILEAVEELAKIPARIPPAERPPGPSGDAFKEVVQRGDNLTSIIAMHNAEFEKRGLRRITQEEVVKANPGLNPNVIVPGQVILIPIPPKR